MSHIKDLIVNGVTRVLGKLIANEISTSSITATALSTDSIKAKTSSNQGNYNYFATDGSIQQPAFIPGSVTTSARLTSVNTASKRGSVAEGYSTRALGDCSHAEGVNTEASGDASHAGGYNTIALGYCQTAIGGYNTVGPGLFIVGNGSDKNTRTNAFRVGEDGTIFSMGAYLTGGADYAEYFEWEDGNPNNEDRIGHFVALSSNGKIKIATSGDKIIGVVSGNASVVGNAFEDTWSGIYLHDVYGRPIKEEIEEERVIGVDEEGNEIKETVKRTVLKVNPDYDPNQTYIPRSQRPEWDIIGLLGQLIVIDDGTCQVGERCGCNDQGIATAGDKYDVIKRLDDTHVVLLTSFLK